jgi:hypothetical protein
MEGTGDSGNLRAHPLWAAEDVQRCTHGGAADPGRGYAHARADVRARQQTIPKRKRGARGSFILKAGLRR